jgi:protein tyrosine phosphatase
MYTCVHDCVFCIFRLRCNLSKNRYKDVVCYDETRVALKAQPGVEGSDYVHANYVSGYNKPQAFILTQG